MNHSSKVSGTALSVKVNASQLVSLHAGFTTEDLTEIQKGELLVRVCIWSSYTCKQPRCTISPCITHV